MTVLLITPHFLLKVVSSVQKEVMIWQRKSKSVDTGKVRVLSCDKRDGESRRGCEKYLPLINCERGKNPWLNVSAPCLCCWSLLTSVKRCCYLLGFTRTISKCSHTVLTSGIRQHADGCLIYQPQMAPANEEFPHSPAPVQCVERVACRNGTEIWKTLTGR